MDPRRQAEALAERTRRRLLLRQLSGLTVLLMLAAATLALAPLLTAKWKVIDTAILTAAPITAFATALSIALGLTWISRPSLADGARALDREFGRDELILTAIDGRTQRAASPLEGIFLERLAERLPRVSPRRAVPLGERGLTRALLLLVCVDAALALTPHRRPEPDASLLRMQDWLTRVAAAPSDSDEVSEVIKSLRQARTRKELEATADAHLKAWREKDVAGSDDRESKARDLADLVTKIREAVAAGSQTDEIKAIEAAVSRLEPGQPGAQDLADALRREAEKSTDPRLQEALNHAANRVEQGGSGAGKGPGTQPKTGPSSIARRERNRVRDILIAVKAGLGESRKGGAPSAPNPESTSPTRPGESSVTLDTSDLSVYPARFRPLLQRYLRRRASRADSRDR